MERLLSCLLPALVLAIPIHAAHAQESEQLPLSIPIRLQPAVEQAEQTGRLLQRLDRAAWLATDAMTADKGSRKLRKSVRGWITTPVDIGTQVLFFDGSAPQKPLYEVVLESSGRIDKAAPTTDTTLNELQLAQIRARESATAQPFLACSRSYNSVIFGKDESIHAYLMPGTTKQGVYPAGGHHLYVFDKDGRDIVSERAFTKSCVDLGGDKRIATLMVTHILDLQPTEIHVFISLNAGVPLYVGTAENRYLWKVDNGKISLVSTPESEGEGNTASQPATE